jgi:CDP-diacylglycerol pyrophosphatase
MIVRGFTLCLAAILLLMVSACQGFGQMPPQTVVELAIATQLAQTQQSLIIHLAPQTPQTPNFKLRHVKVTDRETLKPKDQPSPIYHVQGSYQALIQLPSRQVKEDSIFNLYLQPEKDQETQATQWSLVKPSATGWERVLLEG